MDSKLWPGIIPRSVTHQEFHPKEGSETKSLWTPEHSLRLLPEWGLDDLGFEPPPRIAKHKIREVR